MRLYCTYFNFWRTDRGLTTENENGVREKNTCKECGITKNKWNLTDLSNYGFIKISTN